MQSKATTVEQYLASLADDRRAAISAVREVFRKNLDRGYEEGMQYGMIGWYVPHRIFPAGYHCDPKQPLPFAALASQKGAMSIYLMGLYIGEREADGETADTKRFRAEWTKTGKKLDMGKSCVRFKKVDDLALDVLADTLHRLPVETYVARYEANLAKGAARGTGTKSGSGKPASASSKGGASRPASASSKSGTSTAGKSSRPERAAAKTAKPEAVRAAASRASSPSKAKPASRSPVAKRAR